MQFYTVPEGQRYWVVRASGGDYVDNFVQGGVAAIGHLDILHLRNADEAYLRENMPDIAAGLADVYRNRRAPASVTSLTNQVRRFILEMKPGDLVLTLDATKLVIGRITGQAQIAAEPIQVVYDAAAGRSRTMEFSLRRRVAWGPRFKREEIPFQFEKTLRAHQTVFNLDYYWDLIHHLIYPLFVRDDHVYFSLNIRQKKDIDNYSVGQLLVALSELEILAKTDQIWAEGDAPAFNELVRAFRASSVFDLTTKAGFASQGSIWGKLGISDKTGRRLLFFVLAYTLLFGGGGEWIGFEGLVTPKMRERLLDYVLERRTVHEVDDVVNSLKLQAPKYNTAPLDNGGPALDDPVTNPSELPKRDNGDTFLT